jgi:hypothetical protein
MGDIEETLGHDLQIGCQRHWRTIDVNVNHHSTPLIAAGGLSAPWSNRPSPWAVGHYSARHDLQSKIIFGDNTSPSYPRFGGKRSFRNSVHECTGEQLKQLAPPPEGALSKVPQRFCANFNAAAGGAECSHSSRRGFR